MIRPRESLRQINTETKTELAPFFMENDLSSDLDERARKGRQRLNDYFYSKEKPQENKSGIKRSGINNFSNDFRKKKIES